MQDNAKTKKIREERNCIPRKWREPGREGSLAGGISRKIVSQGRVGLKKGGLTESQLGKNLFDTQIPNERHGTVTTITSRVACPTFAN